MNLTDIRIIYAPFMFWADGMVPLWPFMLIKRKKDFLYAKGLLTQMIREEAAWDKAYEESRRLFIHELYHLKQLKRIKEEKGNIWYYYWKWMIGWRIPGFTQDPLEKNAYKAFNLYKNLSPKTLSIWFYDDQALSSMLS